MNWLHIFCDPDPLEQGFGRLARCAEEPAAPTTYCFGSSDSNWSNNPLIMNRDWFNEKIRDVAFHGEKAWEVNAFFEFNVMMAWLAFRPPAKVCVSLKGIFAHHEVDQ